MSTQPHHGHGHHQRQPCASFAACAQYAALVARFLAAEIGWDTALSGEQSPNRGLGTPLSVAELAQLRRDEQLGRAAALNDGSGSAENAREDEALSRVLMGAELRAK